MKKQIVHISVHQTSKVIAAMHMALITVLFILPTVLGYWFHGHVIAGLLMLLLLPFFIWIFLYIGYVIACWFYNLVIPWTGGIEVEVADVEVQPEPIVSPSVDEVIVNSEAPVVPPEEKDRL